MASYQIRSMITTPDLIPSEANLGENFMRVLNCNHFEGWASQSEFVRLKDRFRFMASDPRMIVIDSEEDKISMKCFLSIILGTKNVFRQCRKKKVTKIFHEKASFASLYLVTKGDFKTNIKG